jgi:hypothetical protein
LVFAIASLAEFYENGVSWWSWKNVQDKVPVVVTT